jgi:enoyl-CoA hydratase/carnithine racemase
MKTTIEQIEEIVIFYNGITKDFQDIERLQSGVRKLATLLFIFAGELGLLYKERNGTEFSRRAGMERKKGELMRAGTSATAADAAAKEFVIDLLEKEQQADAHYQQARLLYDAAGNVLEAMRQHISNLKQEKRLEIQGGMQQP